MARRKKEEINNEETQSKPFNLMAENEDIIDYELEE